MPNVKEQVVNEAALTETTIYQMFNANGEMSRLILSGIKDGTIIDSSYIEEQLLMMKRSKFQLLEKVLNAYELGDITLIYANNVKFTQSLPFFSVKQNGKIRTFIFLNNYGTIVEDKKNLNKKYLNIEMKTLYVLMEGAYVGHVYANTPMLFSRNYSFLKLCADIYTTMIIRILNKEFALSMDREAFAKINFLFAKFFLCNVANIQNSEISYNYARGLSIDLAGAIDFDTIDNQYENSNIQNMEDLINLVKTVSPRVSGLSLKYFTQRYLNTFKAPAIYSMECLPYFLFTIEATLLGSFVVNQPFIYEAIKGVKGVRSFYSELLRVIG